MSRTRNKRRKRARAERHGKERRLTIALEQLELVLGHDGLFRGRPEPSLLLGVYRIVGAESTLIDRRLVRLRSEGPQPERISISEPPIESRIPREEGMRVLLLVFALEEDSAAGVQRLMADLGSPLELSVWASLETIPHPIGLAEWASQPPPLAPASTTVHVLCRDEDLRDAPLGDDWIGAATFHLQDLERVDRQIRCRFMSADGRNDWTLVLRLRLV